MWHTPTETREIIAQHTVILSKFRYYISQIKTYPTIQGIFSSRLNETGSESEFELPTGSKNHLRKTKNKIFFLKKQPSK